MFSCGMFSSRDFFWREVKVINFIWRQKFPSYTQSAKRINSQFLRRYYPLSFVKPPRHPTIYKTLALLQYVSNIWEDWRSRFWISILLPVEKKIESSKDRQTNNYTCSIVRSQLRLSKLKSVMEIVFCTQCCNLVFVARKDAWKIPIGCDLTGRSVLNFTHGPGTEHFRRAISSSEILRIGFCLLKFSAT